MKCDESKRTKLLKYIILSGRTSFFNGMKQRLENDIRKLLPDNYQFNIISENNRKDLSWLGASIVSGMTCHELFITRYVYEEYGVGYVHKNYYYDFS